MSREVTTWNIYVLDDDAARHQLLSDVDGSYGLISALNQNSKIHDGDRIFVSGFGTDAKLDMDSITAALNDPAGIWLVDLHIPKAEGRCLARDIGIEEGDDDLALAKAVIRKLRTLQRPFLIISSGKLSGEEFGPLVGDLGASYVSMRDRNSINGAANEILALLIPSRIYSRAFDEARRLMNAKSYHASVNNGTPVEMFALGTSHNDEGFHDLANWRKAYETLPPELVTSIQGLLGTLMEKWRLDKSVLNKFRSVDMFQNWRLPAAKAVNGGFIHRSFLFALRPKMQDCHPNTRVHICNRDVQVCSPYKGIFGLQTLLSGSPQRGFEFGHLSEWNEEDSSGILLTLQARFDGCGGLERFTQIVGRQWNPPEGNPNSSELSRALKDICDSFATEGSSVCCENNRIVLKLRIRENELR